MESNTSTSHANSGAKVTSHYWGYRELTADEASAVAGGDRGDYGDGGDRGYGGGDTSSASSDNSGNAGCESPGATAERAAGYKACEATAAGLTGASKGLGNWVSNAIAAQIEGACKKGIDNQVSAAWRTANYEFCSGTALSGYWSGGSERDSGSR